MAISFDENNVKWIRPEPLIWIDDKNVSHRYYADFYLPDYDVYLDPKNDYLIKVDFDKIEKTRLQNNVIIIIIDEKNLNWDYVKTKMGIYFSWIEK